MSKQNNSATLPLAQLQSGPSVSLSIQMVFAAADRPQQFPNFRVPPGMSVLLYTTNGISVNTNGCFIAQYPEAIGNSSSRCCPPGADVTVPWALDNLNEIYAAGAVGDGLLAVLQLPQVG